MSHSEPFDDAGSPPAAEAGSEHAEKQDDSKQPQKKASPAKKAGKARKSNPSSAGEKERKEIRVATYVDYSRTPASGLNNVATIFKAASAKEPTFPGKLHLILSNPEFEDIISWMPHGRSWRILRPDVFEDRILPLFFCHCRLSSFMRQVNGWGFRRIKHGPDYNSYYHERFLRGLTHLVESMRRESVTAKSAEGEDEPAPDLYKISSEAPLPENLSLQEYRNRNAGSINPTASIFPAMHQAASNGLAATQMQFKQEPAVVTTSPFGAAGCLGSVPAAPMLPTTMATTNAMPSAGGANQADILNAFRTARFLENQRLAAMSQSAAYGGNVGRWGPFPDPMYQGMNSGQQVMAAQLDFQNRMKYAGMPGMQGIMPGGMVGADMNSLGYRQVAGGLGGHAGGYMQPSMYHPDANALNGTFAQGMAAPQIDFDATIQQMQQMQQLRNANLMGAGLMNPPPTTGSGANTSGGAESKPNGLNDH